MIGIKRPETEYELLDRAWSIAGLTLEELALQLKRKVPENLLRNKGWVGEMLELVLGATAGSKPEPDFQHIGIELKTIPVKKNGEPKESTHVCIVPMTETQGLNWEDALVRQKLARVLWIPVEVGGDLAERRIGAPLLWSPSHEEETLLRADWEEFMELITLGDLDQITAHLGEALQIRPKAANSHALAGGIGKLGESIRTLPRGFYLRTSFTGALLARHYHCY